MLRSSTLAVLFLPIFGFASLSARAQTVYHATQSTGMLSAGAGFSNFSLDWGPGRRMDGITAWVDWKLPLQPRVLQHLGIEIEGREIDFDRPAEVKGMRQETGLGGVTYNLPTWHRFHPYAKYLLGIGGVYFDPGQPYSHDTRTVLAPGGGVDFRLNYRWDVRADYEYQFWRHLFRGHDLNPNGVTVGVAYRF